MKILAVLAMLPAGALIIYCVRVHMTVRFGDDVPIHVVVAWVIGIFPFAVMCGALLVSPFVAFWWGGHTLGLWP